MHGSCSPTSRFHRPLWRVAASRSSSTASGSVRSRSPPAGSLRTPSAASSGCRPRLRHAIEGVKLIEQRAAGRSEARFRSLVQNSSDLIAVLGESGEFTYLAPSVQSVLGFQAEELMGAQFAELLHSEERGAIEAALAAAARSTGNCTLELRMRRRDGSWCRLEAVVSNLLADPSVRGLVVIGHDVTQRRELEEQLSHQAFHDPLTTLANRALFLDRVTNALERSRRTFLRVAVLFIDIDDFKTVNDSLGHAAGDELLVGVARQPREMPCAMLMPWRGSAATNSRSCSRGSTPRRRRSSPGACSRASTSRSSIEGTRDLPAREHRHRARRRRRRARRACSARPTRRCTTRRARARVATRRSVRSCMPRRTKLWR